MKKLVLLAVVAFSFLASAHTTRIQNPVPGCDPCEWVR
jgi:hypothetical protein